MSRWGKIVHALTWMLVRGLSSSLLALMTTLWFRWLAKGEPDWALSAVYILSFITFAVSPHEYKSPP